MLDSHRNQGDGKEATFRKGATSAPAPLITLPKGGGPIRGIGEIFAANPVTGAGSLNVPIATGLGHSGFGPQLVLSYESGAVNRPFGFSWSLSLSERAVCILRESRYLSGWIDVTRFNRRLHKLTDWLEFIARTLSEILVTGAVFVIDSMLPVWWCSRARRCRKVRGREYCGYCAAKKEKFFGWRLHLICMPSGIPASFQLLPAAFQDLTPIRELAVGLPTVAQLLDDKAYNSACDVASMVGEAEVRLIPVRRANMQPHSWFVVEIELHDYRHTIASVNSQCEKMGLERLYTRTNAGFELKVFASIIAISCTNMI